MKTAVLILALAVGSSCVSNRTSLIPESRILPAMTYFPGDKRCPVHGDDLHLIVAPLIVLDARPEEDVPYIDARSCLFPFPNEPRRWIADGFVDDLADGFDLLGFEGFGSEGLYSGRETHIRIAVCDECSRRRRAWLRRRWWRQHVLHNDVHQRERVSILCSRARASGNTNDLVVKETYVNGKLANQTWTEDGQETTIRWADGDLIAVELLDDQQE